MPRKEVYLSISRLGSRLSGSVHSPVTSAIAPLRLVMRAGRPAWAKMGAKESPMTIVYCSEGFCKITGYKRQEIIGRNCRFLQGPGTDQNAVDIIRKGVAEGKDISVCLLNYKADGSPFWNQFFVAALKDSDGSVVNYVGVQCEVNAPHISKIKDRVKKLPIDP